MKSASPKIAIIGAGIAGSFLSCLLAKKGFQKISLFEKKSLVVDHLLGKVCGGCLHKSAVKILKKYDLGEFIQPEMKINFVTLVSPEQKISFNYNHGVWINRKALDDGLRNHAVNLGVELINHQAKILDLNGTIAFENTEQSFDLIIDAGGIGGKALPAWEESERKESGFGFQGYIPAESLKALNSINLETGEVRFYLDDTGYHGVVRAEGLKPYLHVASYLKGKKLQTSPFLKQFFSLEELLEKSATETLYRKRLPAKGRVLLCGDSLGYPEPFTGEGMYFAINTAERLANLIDQQITMDQMVSKWQDQVISIQQRQWRRCQMATWMINSSLKRKLIFPLIPYLAPVVTKLW